MKANKIFIKTKEGHEYKFFSTHNRTVYINVNDFETNVFLLDKNKTYRKIFTSINKNITKIKILNY